MTKVVRREGSVRVDLLGGTTDIYPINLLLTHTKTLNVALSLKAKVEIQESIKKTIEIFSEDYQVNYSFFLTDLNEKNLRDDFFGPMKFVMSLISYFNPVNGLILKLKSGSPPGAGLGGSSAMGITLFMALCDFFEKKISKDEILSIVKDFEAIVLNSGPTGFQDYYPALYGGILSLSSVPGKILVDQLYSEELKSFLENHLLLVYSGDTRLSGINNWEVYKSFFDGDIKVSEGLNKIALLSQNADRAIRERKFRELLNLISEEGQYRESLFPNIMTKKIINLREKLKKLSSFVGIKMCGAGGGGCFLILHTNDSLDAFLQVLQEEGMRNLDFEVALPNNF